MGYVDSIDIPQERDRWEVLENAEMNLWVP